MASERLVDQPTLRRKTERFRQLLHGSFRKVTSHRPRQSLGKGAERKPNFT
jgi:hypothetical protein